jgi:hypothetical protein
MKERKEKGERGKTLMRSEPSASIAKDVICSLKPLKRSDRRYTGIYGRSLEGKEALAPGSWLDPGI